MTATDRLASARAQLAAVKALTKGWDSYDSPPPTPAALAVATTLVESPRVPPDRVGGVHRSEGAVELTWNGSVLVMIHPDGRMAITITRGTRSKEVAVSLVTAATAAEPERASAGAGGSTP